MLSSKYKRFLSVSSVLAFFFLLDTNTARAAEAPQSSVLSNPFALSMITLMVLLLIIIALLGNLLIGVAKVKHEKEKKSSSSKTVASVILLFLLCAAFPSVAQDAEQTAAAAAPSTISGLEPLTFYVIVSIVFLELIIALVLLINIMKLIKEKEELDAATEFKVVKKPSVNWWTKLNSFKPIEQEADIDLGHEYDGIRELDNRLPPWWLYGFYITILAGVIYLWRFHVSHTGLSSKEEYEMSVAKAETDIQEYLKKKGDAVDENNVVVLTSGADISSGKAIFEQVCATCHKSNGAGDVGPNLTDDYWMHGGDIKKIFKTIRYGVNAMPQWQNSYSNKQIAQVASYVKSLHGTNPPNGKAPQGELESATTPAAKDSAVKTAEVKK